MKLPNTAAQQLKYSAPPPVAGEVFRVSNFRFPFLAFLMVLTFPVAWAEGPLQTAPKRDPQYDQLWQDPEVEQRIVSGIQNNRMGFAQLRFTDAQGKALTNVEVRFEQTRHEFLFGCNLFMLGGFSTPEQNKQYEEAFCSVFNMAVLPFYWSDLEPEQGKLRFAKDSPFIYRRPPPDLTLEFCERNHIIPKGHLLAWHQLLPKWLPDNRDEVKTLLINRFEQIAARYGKRIKYWDVVDEALYREPNIILPDDFVYTVMQEAARIFPQDCKLDVADAQLMWTNFHHEDSPFYMMLKILQLRNARFDAVGMSFQSHYLPDGQYNPSLRPLEMFRLLDKYSDFRKPIQFTQVSVPGLPDGPEGEKDQAKALRNVYRLFFSHPNIEMINYWNLPEGYAYLTENNSMAGLLRKDLTPKPGFEVLRQLIRHEWWTIIRQNSGINSDLKLQGFYGDYELTAMHDGKTVERKIHLTKGGNNRFEVQFP
ncbi:MAG: endo-1,4-beta-xylanase [Opitutaceae bacterium]